MSKLSSSRPQKMRGSVAKWLNREFTCTFICGEKSLDFVFHIFRLGALGQVSLWKPLSLDSKLQRATFPAMEAFQLNKRNMMGQMDPSPFGPFLLFHFGSQSHPPAIPGQWRPSQLRDFPRAMPLLPMRTMDRSRSYQNKIYVRAPMHDPSSKVHVTSIVRGEQIFGRCPPPRSAPLPLFLIVSFVYASMGLPVFLLLLQTWRRE